MASDFPTAPTPTHAHTATSPNAAGARLRRHSARLLWLNPLLRFDGYAPLAQGAAVLHRHAHAMLAVHNLESLQQLAGHLARLLAAPGR